MRLRCHLFGCLDSADAPCCVRCGCGIYDPDYLLSGRLDPIRWWLVRLRRRIGRLFRVQRCEVCRRRMWPWSRRINGELCSMECLDRWIPF